MKALVVYDSLFGNTQLIAQAVAAGLGTTDEVELARADELSATQRSWELVVIGAPTQRHQASRPMSDWLNSLGGLPGVPVAAFDTRYRMPTLLSGAASVVIVNRLRAGGAVLVAEPVSFFVRGKEGPLEDGEEQRAEEWGANVRRLYDQRNEPASAAAIH
jgi:flavodoxin